MIPREIATRLLNAEEIVARLDRVLADHVNCIDGDNCQGFSLETLRNIRYGGPAESAAEIIAATEEEIDDRLVNTGRDPKEVAARTQKVIDAAIDRYETGKTEFRCGHCGKVMRDVTEDSEFRPDFCIDCSEIAKPTPTDDEIRTVMKEFYPDGVPVTRHHPFRLAEEVAHLRAELKNAKEIIASDVDVRIKAVHDERDQCMRIVFREAGDMKVGETILRAIRQRP